MDRSKGVERPVQHPARPHLRRPQAHHGAATGGWGMADPVEAVCGSAPDPHATSPCVLPATQGNHMVSKMPAIFNIVILLALALVFATLCFGVYAMFKGGDFGRSWSNRMMRLRVLTQFIAIIIVMTALFFVERMKGG
jgi:hypothetical protein